MRNGSYFVAAEARPQKWPDSQNLQVYFQGMVNSPRKIGEDPRKNGKGRCKNGKCANKNTTTFLDF